MNNRVITGPTYYLPRIMLIPLLIACSPPPPAPEGLNEAARYMVREFYSDDATFEAGFQGFMNWFNDEGVSLVGQRPPPTTRTRFPWGTF